MSTLRVTGLKQETSTATNISLAVGGGVTVAGVSTFHNDALFSNDVTVTGNMNIGGVLTYEDVTNIDSVGVITARSGIDIGTGTSISSPSSNVLTLGTNSGESLRITSTGYVGIGTDNPSEILEVATSVDGEATLATFKNTSGGGTNETVDIKLGLENTIASNVILRAGKEANHSSGAATDNFFAIHTTLDSTSSEKLRITSDGVIHQTSTSFDSVYSGVISADSPTFVAENQTTDTYYRLTGGTYGSASSVSLDLSTHRAKNKGVTSSFRIKNYTGTTGSVGDPKLAFITTTFETDNTTITENATQMELTTSGIRVPNRIYTATTSGNTSQTRTLTLDNIVEGAAYLVTLTRSPSLGTVSIYQTLIRYDGNGNFEGNDDIVNGTPSNMTITYGNATGGTATLTYVNGGTQRFRVTALRVN